MTWGGASGQVFPLRAVSHFKLHVAKFLALSLLAQALLARRVSTAMSPPWKGQHDFSVERLAAEMEANEQLLNCHSPGRSGEWSQREDRV